MDRTIKFLLGVIAASLVMLNLQLAGVSLVSEAHARGVFDDSIPLHLHPEHEGEIFSQRLFRMKMERDIDALSQTVLQMALSSLPAETFVITSVICKKMFVCASEVDKRLLGGSQWKLDRSLRKQGRK